MEHLYEVLAFLHKNNCYDCKPETILTELSKQFGQNTSDFESRDNTYIVDSFRGYCEKCAFKHFNDLTDNWDDDEFDDDWTHIKSKIQNSSTLDEIWHYLAKYGGHPLKLDVMMLVTFTYGMDEITDAIKQVRAVRDGLCVGVGLYILVCDGVISESDALDLIRNRFKR